MSEEIPIEGATKKIAILIAVLAAFLAIAETGAKSAQTEVLTAHIEAADQWGFFQAKTIRQTVIRAAAEALEAPYKDGGAMPPAVKAQIDAWKATDARYESDPETKDGRKELAEKALSHSAQRERARAAYHHFEYGSAAFQLAIVLASAAAITSVAMLSIAAGGLGIVGAGLTMLGFVAPTLIHF